jgi:hypothetical protein
VRPLALLVTVLAALSLLTPPAQASPATIITVGTSIEAGVGVNVGESWPSRLDERTDATVTDLSLGGGAYTAPNSVGDTIRKHVQQAIEQHPDVIILGGPVNDLVRLSDVTPLREAVFDAANAVQAAGIRVDRGRDLPVLRRRRVCCWLVADPRAAAQHLQPVGVGHVRGPVHRPDVVPARDHELSRGRALVPRRTTPHPRR